MIRLRNILGPKEFETATLLAQGLHNQAIADRQKVTNKTIERRIHLIYKKLGYGYNGGRDVTPRVALTLRMLQESTPLEHCPGHVLCDQKMVWC